MTVLDDVLGRLTADRILHDPAADGRGITVVSIDTGVDRDLLRSRHPACQSIRTFRRDAQAIVESDAAPGGPHGTTVADILLTVAPKISLVSIDLFATGAPETEAVVAAIHFALALPARHVVNLSLGIAERTVALPAKRLALSRAIEAAYHAGVTVAAAANNDHPLAISYPAAFAPPLLSVDKGLFPESTGFAYRPRDGVEFAAHATGYLGPFVREPMTSWATPHLSGLAARLLSLKPDLKPFEIKALLAWMGRPR